MSLDAIRGPIQGLQPTFAGTLPGIQTDRQIRLTNDTFDMFAQAAPKSARIVLRPADGIKSDLSTSLTTHLQSLTSGLQGSPVDSIVDALASVLGGKPVDPNGNVYATYKEAQTERTPAGTTLTEEEQAEKEAAKAKIGVTNTGKLVEAVKEKLDELPPGTKNVTIDLPRKLPQGVNAAELVRELAELATLSGYNYNFNHASSAPSSRIGEVAINKGGLSAKAASEAINEGQSIGDAMNLTRHLVDSPANRKSAAKIASIAQGLASPTLNVDVLEGADLEGTTAKNNKRMGLLLGVAQGNGHFNPDRDPRLVEMVYTPPGWNAETGKTVMLVGKGIIFDTGGNNLKPSEYIHNMEGDMAGAAAVIGTMSALDKLQLEGVRVIGLTPLTENRMGMDATLPNDIHVSRAGKTVQISNTDAEGRLILADAIHYGMEKYQPDAVADIATLTGGKVRAVGEQNAVALSGNNPALMKQVNDLEKSMRRTSIALPLTQAHHAWVTRGGKGKADVCNSVKLDDAKVFGVISKDSIDPTEPMRQHSAQGAAFLREFFPKGLETTPWVHYDMAGAEFDKPDPKRGNDEWATGFGVKELFYFVKNLQAGQLTADAEKSEVIKKR